MPFTFSHPALVLPLTVLPKRWYSLTGLVIGSITPDFEYFIHMSAQSNYAHYLGGLFWFDLPLGLLIAFIFHNIVRDSLIDNLPSAFQSRLAFCKNFRWNGYFRKNWHVVFISLLIGAGSHILWDSFSHRGHYFVDLIPFLQRDFLVMQFSIPVYQIMQHMGSLLGALIILISILHLKSHTSHSLAIRFEYWMIVMFISFLVLSIRITFGAVMLHIADLVISAISAGLIALILTPIIQLKIKWVNKFIPDRT